MIRSRVIKIDGAFYETKAEKSHIEVQVPLRIAGDRSHMVKSWNCFLHRHHIVGKWIQSAKAFGARECSFCAAEPMRSHATIALTTASVAPIAMISLKECTKDSQIACPIHCRDIWSNSAGREAPASLLR